MRACWRLAVAALSAAAAAWTGLSALAAEPSPSGPAAPLDYRRPSNWVCLPGRADACRDDLATASIGADGRVRRVAFQAAAAPKVDCFYLYPTVSHGPAAMAPPVVTGDERRAVRQQFARFASVCRLYAPLYRQVTVTAMKAGMAGQALEGGDRAAETARADVAAAWKTYLQRDNRGRGVVLIGHSQGSFLLIDLMRRELDGKPLQRRLVSAIVPGAVVMAPSGADVGGTFAHIPACRRPGQTGCVLSWNSYRADHPVPREMVLPHPPGQSPLCTNPAALAGGPGPLDPVLSTAGETIIPDFTASQGPWTDPPKAIEAPFVTEPGLFRAECRDDAHGVWLAVWPQPAPGDRRTGRVTGDLVTPAGTDPTMGLHLLDLNLPMGNLLDLVRAQAAEYGRGKW